MTNQAKITKLKKYREILVYIKGEKEKEHVQENTLDKPKVLVLKKKFNGQDLKV